MRVDSPPDAGYGRRPLQAGADVDHAAELLEPADHATPSTTAADK